MDQDDQQHVRFVDKQGNFNVSRQNVPRAYLNDLYHWLITMRWRYFFGFFICFYLGVNAIFGCLYLLGGDCIKGARVGHFGDAFFFSVQTLSTIGYGTLSPHTTYANTIVTIEAFCGFLITALLTGLVFSKFSLPSARVVFSKNVIIRQLDGQQVLMFRAANMRTNQIVDATMNVLFAYSEELDGIPFRRLKDLSLVRRQTSMFALSWTAMHFIDEESPLFDMLNHLDWFNSSVELVVSVSGIDGTFGHTIQARHSYTYEQVVFDREFVDIITPQGDGSIMIDYAPFHDLKPMEGSQYE